MSETPRRPSKLSVLQLLAGLQQGSIINDIDGELAKLGKLVATLQKAGSLTLKIDVQPVKNVPHGLYIGAEISAKLPKQSRPIDMLFSDAEGGLHKNDPRQMDAFENLKPRPLGSVIIDRDTGEMLPGGTQSA